MDKDKDTAEKKEIEMKGLALKKQINRKKKFGVKPKCSSTYKFVD